MLEYLSLSKIQPSQLYISSQKLEALRKQHPSPKPETIPPIPVKQLGERVFATDGHTRAVLLRLNGYNRIRIEWETDDLDWEMYEVCLQWCAQENLFSLCDLTERIIPHEEYEVKWYQRCEIMQNEISQRRAKKEECVTKSVHETT